MCAPRPVIVAIVQVARGSSDGVVTIVTRWCAVSEQ